MQNGGRLMTWLIFGPISKGSNFSIDLVSCSVVYRMYTYTSRSMVVNLGVIRNLDLSALFDIPLSTVSWRLIVAKCCLSTPYLALRNHASAIGQLD